MTTAVNLLGEKWVFFGKDYPAMQGNKAKCTFFLKYSVAECTDVQDFITLRHGINPR
jgi:hypothetical protein